METILVVVSEPKPRHRLADVLSKAGYGVVEAECGKIALKLAPSVLPSLVLMAIVMPELNGLQTAARLRTLLGPDSAPIILLGSLRPLGIDEEPLASLIDGYLNIDVSPDELLADVAKQIRRRSGVGQSGK